MRYLVFFLLFLAGCIEQQEYECCRDGTIEICTCSSKTLCSQQAFIDHGDGTCSTEGNISVDTASN